MASLRIQSLRERLSRRPRVRTSGARRRTLALSAVVVLVGIGLLTWSIASASPAGALICDADQQVHGIAGSQARGVTNERLRVDGYAIIKAAGSDSARYADGLGLTFTTFGMNSCGDLVQQGAQGTANTLWSVAALLPLRVVGAILDFSLGGKLAEALLGATGTLASRLHETVFLQWSPLIITIVMVGLIFKVVRRGGKQALGQVAWMVLVIVFAGIFGTSTGVELASKVNKVTADVTRCVAIAPTGRACDGGGSISDAMLESLVGSTWGAGALGDLGNETAPTVLQFAKRSGVPKIAEDWSVTVPIAAIPAVSPDAPTWAEVWRWTGAYTTAESSRLGVEAESRCDVSEVPTVETLSRRDQTELSRDQICSYKWIVRAALLSELATSYPEAYEDARGATSSATHASLSAMALVPAMLGIALLGAATLLAEVELILLIASSPLLALWAMADPRIGRQWFGKVAATVVRRVIAGMVVGIAVLALTLVQSLVDGKLPGATGISVPTALRPITVGVLGVVVAVAALKYSAQFRDMATQTLKLPPGSGLGDSVGDRAKQAGHAVQDATKGAAGAAVAAGVGAATGGAGARGAGALRGALGALSGPRRGFGSAVRSGLVGGDAARKSQNAPAEAVDTTPTDSPVPDDRGPTDGQAAVARSWQAFIEHPDLRLAAQVRALAARTELQAAQVELREAQDRLAAAQALEKHRITQRTIELTSQGHDQVAARGVAERESDERLAPLEVPVALAQERSQRALREADRPEDAMVAAVRRGTTEGRSVDEIAHVYGLSPSASEALRDYQRAVFADRASEPYDDEG